MNKIYDFDEFLNESQRELSKDLMHQVKKHFNINGKLWLDSEGRVCCDGNVSLIMKSIRKFPFQWGSVGGMFYCSYCELTSLEGAPLEVKGDFQCYRCPELTSLKGAPREVGGSFNCSNNVSLTSLKGVPEKIGRDFKCAMCPKLTSLKGSPKEVKGNFDCYECPRLTSLKGAPQEVDGYFDCNSCPKLTSLKGAPRKVGGNFYCNYCPNLTSLEGSPEEVKGNFDCSSCPKLTSLKGAPSKVGGFDCYACQLLPEEEVALAKHPELLKSWLKSGLELEVWKKEKRGLVASKKFGF